MNPPTGMPVLPSTKSAVKSRPLYPYPQIAGYRGKGDANLAESQQARPALYSGSSPAWIGSFYFTPESFQPTQNSR